MSNVTNKRAHLYFNLDQRLNCKCSETMLLYVCHSLIVARGIHLILLVLFFRLIILAFSGTKVGKFKGELARNQVEYVSYIGLRAEDVLPKQYTIWENVRKQSFWWSDIYQVPMSKKLFN